MDTLDQLRTGQRAFIVEIHGEDATTTRLMEMGLCEGESIEVIGRAPLRDPVTVMVRGSRLALRMVDARRIQVRHGDPDPVVTPRLITRPQLLEQCGLACLIRRRRLLLHH